MTRLLNALRAFWRQPSKRYRNFQLVFLVLTLNFAIPSFSYIFTPDVVMGQLDMLNQMLGGDPYPQEQAVYFWRYLGAANVATLAFMCALLQWDVHRFGVVVVPLTFLKSMAATLWLAGWIAQPSSYPVFLAAAILDYVTSAAFVFFVRGARRDIDEHASSSLVPTPPSLERNSAEAASSARRPEAAAEVAGRGMS